MIHHVSFIIGIIKVTGWWHTLVEHTYLGWVHTHTLNLWGSWKFSLEFSLARTISCWGSDRSTVKTTSSGSALARSSRMASIDGGSGREGASAAFFRNMWTAAQEKKIVVAFGFIFYNIGLFINRPKLSDMLKTPRCGGKPVMVWVCLVRDLNPGIRKIMIHQRR